MLCRSCVGPNLFTYHNDWRSQGITMFWGHGNLPPFQIDANFGFTAAVIEMLIFSKPGLVKLLPALPTNWKKGAICGILCRGGIRTDIKWDIDKGEFTVMLESKTNQEILVKFPGSVKEIRSIKGMESCFCNSDIGNSYRKVTLIGKDKFVLQVII